MNLAIMADIAGWATLVVWLYLAVGRGRFWLATERDDGTEGAPAVWPRVAIVVPARDEAGTIAQSVESLLRQDYAGDWELILVDDNSSDGTAEIARQTAARLGVASRLRLVRGCPLAPGWTGKLWAVKQGVAAALGSSEPPRYLLLTDADIVHAPDALTRLVARAEAGGLVLTSLMAKLRCESFAERSHVPAFIFFFQMLYPFSWVNRPGRRTAAGAGGCMLVRADALAQAGGIDAVRSALIDDCALARALKARGPIWLGLTDRVRSVRPYPTLREIGSMISRSAYAQLNYSPLALAGTAAGMALTYVAPPLLAVFADGSARVLGIVSWLLMAALFQPTLRFYRLSPVWGLALPAIGLSYLIFTLESALQFTRGRGGMWKGRVQAAGP
ncbi:MAG TPA: glycosyltransferase [Xanthobacteraceae bacterium]|nr:glycosyltransferase [Xanthobacteraceae bacterium]